MSELVIRLRELRDLSGLARSSYTIALGEAADEIERLRVQLKSIAECMDTLSDTLSDRYDEEEKACARFDEEITQLTALCREFVPRPERMSGYDNCDCPDEYKPAIRMACEFHGVAVPEHLRATEVGEKHDQ